MVLLLIVIKLNQAFFKIFKIYGENVGLSALNYHIKNIGKSRY